MNKTTYEHRFRAPDIVWALGLDKDKQVVPVKCQIVRVNHICGEFAQDAWVEYDVFILENNGAVIYSWGNDIVCVSQFGIRDFNLYDTEKECMEALKERSEAFRKGGYPAWINYHYNKEKRNVETVLVLVNEFEDEGEFVMELGYIDEYSDKKEIYGACRDANLPDEVCVALSETGKWVASNGKDKFYLKRLRKLGR